jgi:H+/Cl- antiporter ClcA
VSFPEENGHRSPRQRIGYRQATHNLGDFPNANPRILLISGLGLLIGLVSGCVAFALLRLIGLITNAIFYGRFDTALVAPDGAHAAWYVVLLAPIVGGLVIGFMARYGSEKIRGHGIPEAIESILVGGSKIQPRVSVIKPVASAVAIGTGGPFGAEGPIIMTGGAFGSLFAQFLKLTADERKTLLVAGAAGGMAATFNAPLASLLLAVEMLLFEWRPRSYVPCAASIAGATVIRRVLIGSGPLFPVPHHAPSDLGVDVYVFCLLAGVIAGVLALIATWLVYAAEDAFRKLPIHWMWWPAIGGLIIGIGGLFVPQALGVGYDIIGQELAGHIGIDLVVGILVVKTLIWSLSLGSGTSGGVLAPMFMIGGALGAVEALVFPDVSPGFWALVGLAGVLGGVMRSPFTGVVFSIELTHEISVLLPLIIGASAAYVVSVLILKRSILTEKVARRGFHLTREYTIDPLEVLFIREVMKTEFVSFRAGTPLANAASTFVHEQRDVRDLQNEQRMYPVLDGTDRLVGIVTRRDMLDAALSAPPLVAGGPHNTVEAAMVARPIVCFPDETLRVVANRMAETGISRVPVVERNHRDRVLGVVTLVDLLEGRLVDLEEERHAERVLRVRTLFPLGAGRFRSHTEEHTEDELTDARR